ncbi:MAG: hypothetical protein ACTS22_00755 [Phycisphaerales bacterium]
MIKRLTIVAAVVAAIAVVAGVLHLANTVQRNRLLNDARRDGLIAYERGEYEAAVEHLGYYNTRRPDDLEAAVALASARGNRPNATREDFAAAATLARKAWDLDPSDLRGPLIELKLRERLNQHTERLETAERILNRHPNQPEAAMARVESLASLGRRDEAIQAARSLAEADPTNIEAHRIVLRLLAGFDAERSRTPMREYAEQLREAHPDEPLFTIMAAQAMAQSGSFGRAQEFSLTLLEPAQLERVDTEALTEAVRLFDALAMRESSERFLAALADRQDLADAIGVIGIQRAYQAGRTDEARQLAQLALDRVDTPDADLLLWARIAGLDTDVRSAPDAETFHMAVSEGLDALRNADPAAAARHLEDARRERPNDPLVLAGLAQANDRMGAWVEAQRLREAALRAAPAFSIVRLAQINAHLDRDEAAQAVRDAITGLQIDPNNGGLALAYAMSVARAAEIGVASAEEIRSALQLARELDGPVDAPATPASPIVARLLIARGMLVPAANTIDRILAAAPGSLEASQLLALADAARGADLLSADAIVELVDRDPRIDPFLLLDRAERLARRGLSRDGLTIFDAALAAVDGDSARSHGLRLARAVFLDRIGDPDALAELRRLAESKPDDAVTQAIVLESSAAWDDEQLVTASIRHLRRLTGEQHSAWRLHESRRLLAFESDEASAARVVGLLDPLLGRPSVDPAAHLVLSDAFRVLGDPASAIQQLELAADAGLDEPGVHLRLIGLLQSEGEIESAQRRARVLAAMDPVSTQVRRERAATLISLGLFEEAARDAEALEASGEATDLLIAATVAARAGDEPALSRRLDALAQRRDLPATALASAGELLVIAGRTEDAFALLAAHRPVTTSAEFARAEAAVLLASEQPGRAIEELRDAYAVSGDPADALLLARVLAGTGDAKAAELVVANALAARPEDPELSLLASAIAVGEAGLAAGGTARTAADRTIAAVRTHLVDANDPEAFIREIRAITTEAPTYYPAWAVLSAQLFRIGRVEEAAETALTAGRLLPDDPRPARLAVEIMLELRPLTRALAAARDWQRRARPDTYEADTTVAAILIQLGRHRDAASLLSKWADRIARDASTPPVLVRMYAAQLAADGRPSDARALFDAPSRTNQGWNEHRIELARDLIAYMDAPNAARAWLNELDPIHPDQQSLLLRAAQAWADLATRTGRNDDRLASLEAAEGVRAVATGDYARSATLLVIDAHRRMGAFAQAAELAEQLVSEAPNNALARCLLVQVHADARVQPDLANDLREVSPVDLLGHAERAVELAADPRHPDGVRYAAMDALGRARLLAGFPELAEDTFRRLVTDQPDNPAAKIGLAEAFRDQGSAEQARRVLFDPLLRDALDRRPGLAPRFDRIMDSISVAAGGD